MPFVTPPFLLVIVRNNLDRHLITRMWRISFSRVATGLPRKDGAIVELAV